MNKKKSKAALYIRVSTHYQIDKDSLPFQRKELINYCKYALNIDDYEVFEAKAKLSCTTPFYSWLQEKEFKQYKLLGQMRRI